MRQPPTAQTADTLHGISTEQLRYLGTRHLVYLKALVRNGESTFVIYGADGTPLEAVDAVETAFEKAALNGLCLVAIH